MNARRPAFARWLDDKNEITRMFLAAGSIPNLVNLAGGLPEPSTYPVEELAGLARRAVAEHPGDALSYPPIDGLPALRDALAATDAAQQRPGERCSGLGGVDLRSLRASYNVAKHPDVVAGTRNAKDVRDEFITTLNTQSAAHTPATCATPPTCEWCACACACVRVRFCVRVVLGARARVCVWSLLRRSPPLVAEIPHHAQPRTSGAPSASQSVTRR